MQEDNNHQETLIQALACNLEKSDMRNSKEVILIIPPYIYERHFAGSNSELQYFLRELAIRFKLEVSANSAFHGGVRCVFRKEEDYYNNLKRLK